MDLELELVTSFHLELVTVDWLRKLQEFLQSQGRLRGSGIVSSDYNEDRFMGPQSVVKYRFRVEFADLPSQSPLWCGHLAEVEYKPKTDSFQLRNVWWNAYWKDEVDLEGAGLPRLTDLPEPDVVRLLGPAEARAWAMVPVTHEDAHVVVAFADPEQIERAADIGWQFQRPVRLRVVSAEELSAIIDAVHGPLEAVEFLALSPRDPLEGEACERNLFAQSLPTPGLGERYLRLDTPDFAISVEKVRDRISAFYQRREWDGCRVRVVPPGEWEGLVRLADDDLVWTKVPEGEGERWKVVSSSAAAHRVTRRWSQGSLPDEPFTRLGLGMLLAGFEVEVERETHWL